MTIIRPYAAADWDALKRLMIELQHSERQIDPARAEPTDAFAAWYLSRLMGDVAENEGVVLVAEQSGAVCGFVAAYAEEERENQSRDFYISEVVVATAYRQQGIGAFLLRAIEQHARSNGFKRLHIGVLAGSAAALALYRKLGFRDYVIDMMKELD